MRRIVAVSDFCTRVPPLGGVFPANDRAPRLVVPGTAVQGGYLERLPLAVVRAGLADSAEVWSFAGAPDDMVGATLSPWGIMERRFGADGHGAPYGSAGMLAHIVRFGAPDILCVWGLGVTEETLAACAGSVIMYNSLDVAALRIPPEISRHCDIFLTGSGAQSAEVQARHPGAVTAMLPVGPEFASAETFYPTGVAKDWDVIYVAAAQAYKRHDILFDALASLPRTVRALCVMGYGEMGEALRQRAAELALTMDFVGPPGVSHAEVNRLMNRARVGVVCGVDDGAPAILTEYMLAGLPVLANAALRCGLQYIRPDTGRTADARDFGAVLTAMLADTTVFAPRAAVLANWTWEHSMKRLAELIAAARQDRRQRRQA